MVAAVAEADEVGGDSCSGQGRRQRHTEATSMVDKDEGSGGRSGQRRQRRRTRTCATMAARPWTWTLRRMQRRVARCLALDAHGDIFYDSGDELPRQCEEETVLTWTVRRIRKMAVMALFLTYNGLTIRWSLQSKTPFIDSME
ncbi:Os01g0758800 [Oryza sativa Japonica Group]|uniref:Os01g0758800 protein n=1 Tax=Oryza sativa subsp. japonica TaxID=39947 RepID=Q0JJ59_ORYSJ|nr:Os01g0758800 [Oryza sativa Japonica Group]|eukprot:NP_001044305.1 Os01g0758800 [Oryza sativa Japonica Group]